MDSVAQVKNDGLNGTLFGPWGLLELLRLPIFLRLEDYRGFEMLESMDG